MNDAKPALKQKKWIYFYLWRHRGVPIYVGQAADVQKRNRVRMRGKGCGALGIFLKSFRDECTLEQIDGIRVWDVTQGRWANGIENALMTLYETHCHSVWQV